MFQDRRDAGRQLARYLQGYALKDPIVLALPRGGVPVAYEIARSINAPLDVLPIRKLGTPGHEELAMGAVGPGNVIIQNEQVIGMFGIRKDALDSEIRSERQRLVQQLQRFRGSQDYPDLHYRTVIIVDDGIATGSTIMAAVQTVQELGAQKIFVAVPVASNRAEGMLRPYTDQFISLLSPSDFYAVGQFYEDFSQTSDQEVIDLLKEANQALIENNLKWQEGGSNASRNQSGAKGSNSA